MRHGSGVWSEGWRERAAGLLHGLAVLALVLGSAPPAAAQLSGVIVPTGRQDYFVLGHEQHVWNMMQRVRSGEGGPNFQNGMNSVVSAVASSDGQVVTYDHWEDTFEADPWAPVQGTTLVLGDGINANGRACDWTNDPRVVCGGASEDQLFRGSALTLNSDQGLGCAAPPNDVQCTVPVNPRSAVDIRFDGGDRLVTSGGPLSLVHNQFPPPYPQIGGSTEVLPRQAFAGATSYSIPAGEDLYAFGGPYQMFQYTSVNIVAFDDGTQVFINSPGAGTASFTLNRGEHYTNCLTWDAAEVCNGGAIDATAAPSITINSSTKISATGPIAILLFSGGDGTWATDFMPILPELLHGNDYILPSPGDDPAVLGSRPLNLYLYNPDPVNAISVDTADTTGTATIAVATETTIDYQTAVGRYVPTNSTVRLTSSRSFWGLAIHDHLSPANDWGYSWLATDFLTRNYTVSYAPGLSNPPGSWPTCGVSPVAAPGTCDSLNRSAVFVAASLDFTLVKVDFDNDGQFDIIDTDSDDFPDPGVATDSSCAGGLNCLYRVDALQTLRIFDFTDYDNTGTRIQASKPIAVAYGQDTDQATGPDAILDTGYTVYPLSQRFLDPVLVAGKEVTPTVVPDTGGQATFTITAQSFAFTPLTNMTVSDLLPTGLTQADYAVGSTLITYPDLSQGTADPTFSIDPGTGRTRLTWTLSPDTMGQDQVLTVRFTLNIPAGPSTTFANEAFVSGVYAGRTYNAVGGADVVRTSVALTKLVTDDGSPEPGDVLTYTLQIANNGGSAETNVVLTDPIPPGTTLVGGSITTQAPFAGSYDPAQNAVVWTAASFASAASATLTFQVVINADTAIGRVLLNSGIFESDATPTFFSNEVSTTVVGPTLEASKTIVGGAPTVLHPNELVTFEVQVTNRGASAATSFVLSDPLAFSNATYQAGTMEMSLNGTAFVALTDASDGDEGTLTGTTLELALATLAARADVRFRFQARVDLGTVGLFVNNQATAAATEVGTTDTNLVQVPVVGDAEVTGHVFLDTDGDGVQDPGEPDLANVNVEVTDSTGVTQIAVTDANGDYSAFVPAGNTTLNVDETDPDMPPGAVLTTANDPQVVVAVALATVNSPDVGYDLPPLSIVKTSDAGGAALPGQTITYTIEVTNNEATTQTEIALTDAVPAGTAYLGGTVSGPALRVTEYSIDATACGGSAFTGLTCDITLNDDLLPEYFAIVQGADGDGGGSATDPDQNFAALAADPFGTGELGVSAGANVIQLVRGGTSGAGDSWEGVVTVVECLASCDTDGFRLIDVQRIALPTGATPATETGSETSGTAWTDLSRVVLFGAADGAGCDTEETAAGSHQVCALMLTPSGTDTIGWERRRAGGANFDPATATVMAVQWGASWDVYGRTIVGASGGDGAAAAADYDTATIPSVVRDRTWVWGSSNSADNGIGDGAEGTLITLGDGQNQNANETTIAAGSEYTDDRSVRAYALTHPGLAVDYRFKADGDSGAATVSVAVDAAGSQRMALVTNGCNGTGTAFARPIFSARYTGASTVELQRRRTGQDFPAWVQGIDFSNITASATAGTPPNVITAGDGWVLPPGATLTVTYQVQVTAGPGSGQTQVVNTASTRSAEFAGPYTDTAIDTLLFLGVEVEPNNAGYAQPGTTITFTHTVLNQGSVNDSYDLTVASDLGWAVDLIDPDTGVVIARDSNGDGTWDGVTPNTGTLAPGTFEEYELRVWVPGGTPAGTQDTVTLTGVSSYGLPYADDAEDEITVLSSTLGDVIVTPDNSGIVRAGSFVAYSHQVINNTGVADTFDLSACSSRLPASETTCTAPYQVPIHWDTNGDGVYTPGTDLQITNTAQLPPGGSQLVFVVVDAWTGAAAGDVDIAYITAESRNDPETLFGAASDTTTFVDEPDHDLSGGGTRVVAPSDVSIHPGTLVNLSTSDDRYNLSISVANLFGVDGLLHPTELWADGDGDGTPELVARDDDGDGVWDTVNFDTDGDLLPDVPVDAGDTASYELRRPVDPAQELHRDYVTLTSDAITGTTVNDSVTATWVFAAVTRASIRGVRVDPEGSVSFVTTVQAQTASFVWYQTDDPSGLTGRERLHDEAVRSPVPDSLTPILYRVATLPVTKPFVVVEETETDGDVVWGGPFAVGDERQRLAFDTVERLMDEAGIPYGAVQRTRGMRPLARAARDSSMGRTAGRDRAEARAVIQGVQAATALSRRARSGVKITVHQPGQVRVPLASLEAAGLGRARPGSAVHLFRDGLPVAYRWEQDVTRAWSLVFQDDDGLTTDFADSSVYVATVRSVPRALQVPFTASAAPRVPGFTRVEKEVLYVPSLSDDHDPWQWDILFSGWPWPDPGWDPTAGDFDLPTLSPGATGSVEVRIRLAGYTHHSHSVTATLNGLSVGSVVFDGAVGAVLTGSVDASSLAPTGNTLALTYIGSDLPDSTEPDAMAYVDSMDLAIPTTRPTAEVAWSLSAYEPRLPAFGGVDYLVVTHPLFRDQAQRVADLKALEGLHAVVVDTHTAYDRFSAGVVEPRAIQALIRKAWARSGGALRFVLLVGDDTFDPRDHVGIGSQTFVPGLYARDATWGLVPSETPYADVDDDGRADLAIGRLPVHSTAEADAVVDKIAAQAQALQAFLGAQLVVSDDASETDAPFRSDAEDALRLLPASTDVRWSDLAQGAPAARATLLQGWSDGVLLSHYFGHGGLTEWADEQILTTADVQALGASWQPTVLFTWACLSQWYVGIDGPSLNEALLLQAGGGAVASFGPAGITPPARQAILAESLYRELARPGATLGEAIRDAKNLALEDEPNAREVIEGFHLFGDPALQLPWPGVVPQ